MKIVIDIDKDVYTRLFDNGIQDNEIAVDDVCEMARALRLGRPLEAQPCEDCISREQAVYVASGYCEPQNIADELRKLPSVTPQPKKGKWIEEIDEIDSLGNKTWHYKCSICENRNSGWGDYNYCPNCGADMREVNADEK